jgi:hypothetical protein
MEEREELPSDEEGGDERSPIFVGGNDILKFEEHVDDEGANQDSLAETPLDDDEVETLKVCDATQGCGCNTVEDVISSAASDAQEPLTVHERVSWLLALEAANLRLEVYKLKDRIERMYEAAIRAGFTFDLNTRALVQLSEEDQRNALANYFGVNLTEEEDEGGSVSSDELEELAARFKAREDAEAGDIEDVPDDED